GDADWTVSAKESPPAEKLAPAGIPDRTTPSNPRRKKRRKKGRKGASAPIVRAKSTAPVGGNNRFGALLGTNGNEGILGGTGKVPRGSTPSTTDSGATANVETTTITTPEGSVSASGWFSWPKFCPSYLLRLFAILALLCLGTAFALSSYPATSALLSSQWHESPTSFPAVTTPIAPASLNGFCEVGGIDTSSFVAIVSSDSAPANHPVRARSRVLVSAPRKLVTNSPLSVQGGHDEGRSLEALMDDVNEAVGEPLHLIGQPPASVKEIYEKQPAEADLETVLASRNSMERKGEPEFDLVGPVYSNRTGIIARGRDTVLPVNDTSPELRPADAGKPGMLEVRKLVETGLGAPVASMHAGGEWRAIDGLTDVYRVPTKDLFLQLGRAVDPLLAEPAWPEEVRAAQISDSNAVESDIFSVSSACADWQPRCAAPAWHEEPHHATSRPRTDKPPAPPADELSIDPASPFNFPFISGHSSSAPGRAQLRGQLWAALFLLLGACGGVLLSVRRSKSGRLVRCRTGHGAWLLLLAMLPLASPVSPSQNAYLVSGDVPTWPFAEGDHWQRRDNISTHKQLNAGRRRPHCPISMDLLLSTFITNKRSRGNRYSRLQVFRHAMRSYFDLPINGFYLFIQLDEEFSSQRQNLENELTSSLGSRLQHLEFTRILTQAKWKWLMSSIGSDKHSGRLVFFLQNDDHVFIDVDTSLLCQGLMLLHSEPSKFKTLYMSHWPEALRLTGKVSPPQRIGGFVRTNLTMLDAVQVFNLGFLHHIFVELEWPQGLQVRRIDRLIMQRAVWGTFAQSLLRTADTENSLQAFFVPLRELCRKFDGYMHVGIPFAKVPQLEINHTQPVRSADSLKQVMLAAEKLQNDPWSRGNNFSVPAEWVSVMLDLYGVPRTTSMDL
ncbi:hypothetical protein EMIHUDRAFT_250373, partial [Emiliania huxleyi CCMP1516]|uniref:Nucleotide-diphospho-sugar transferase domain-containing protein n=2 Tax=Emiliania huxleyi TaxID=2903 RepID=A0A0D3I0Y6_EMIH1